MLNPAHGSRHDAVILPYYRTHLTVAEARTQCSALDRVPRRSAPGNIK
ncbi:hypothetical protein ACFSTC_00015 [Nonomuraea ferruginea]